MMAEMTIEATTARAVNSLRGLLPGVPLPECGAGAACWEGVMGGQASKPMVPSTSGRSGQAGDRCREDGVGHLAGVVQCSLIGVFRSSICAGPLVCWCVTPEGL